MQLLIPTVDFWPSVGGVQSMLWNVIAALPAGTRVRVLTWSPGPEGRIREGLRVVRSSGSWRSPAGQFRGLRRLTSGAGRDSVLVCGHLFLLPAAYVAARTRGLPLVCVLYGSELLSPAGRRIATTFLPRCDLVLPISSFTEALALRLGARDRAVARWSPGVPRAQIAAAPRRDASEDASFVVLGRLVRHKGGETALRALSDRSLVRSRCRIRFIGDGPERVRLEEQATRLDVSARVDFLGRLPRAASAAALRQAVALLQLSYRDGSAVEGFGLAVLEGAALSVPAIVSDSGGLPDTVDHGATGLIVPPCAPSLTAHAMERLLTDPDLTRRMGRAAQERVLRHFTAEERARDLVSMLSPLLARQ